MVNDEKYYQRPESKKNRPRMPREERAKQFMPFAALKGYPDALRKKEKIVVPRVELSEEMARVLNEKMNRIQKKDIVVVTYFYRGEYLKMEGIVSRMDVNARILKVVNTSIPFDDILDVEISQSSCRTEDL